MKATITRWRSFTVAASAVVLTLPFLACGNSNDSCDTTATCAAESPDAGTDAMLNDQSSDAPAQGDRTSPDGSTADARTDAPVDAAPCTPPIPSDADAVFVQAGAAGSACSMAAPCGTFAAAFAKLGARARVYVAEGTYTETFTLPGGVAVLGGWTATGASWSFDCSGAGAAKTIVASDGSQPYAVAYSAAASSSLDTLTLTSSGAAADRSTYGLFVSGAGASTVLTLNNVSVTARDARAGASGSQGGTGTAGTGFCNAAGGGAGSPGGGGTAGTASYSAAGYAPGTGGTGSMAGAGAAGTAPATAHTCVGPGSLDCSQFGDPMNGCVNPTYTDMSCGTDGKSGCGGGGGSGGTGGSGGGSSIALFVWNATAHVNGGSLTAGNAGKGGDGAAGGSGGNGSTGAAGMPGPLLATMCMSAGTGPNNFRCDPKLPQEQGAAGSAGGMGGTGGVGGAGGGGNGGDSYAYYTGGGGSAVVSAALQHGTGGQGGAGGNTGTAGVAADHN